MTDTVLKPCPFCGGTAEIKRRGTARMSMLIGCVDCHAEVESGDVCGMTAVENYKWNMRKARIAPVHAIGALLVRFTLYTEKKCFENSFVVEKHDFPFLYIIFSDRFKELACAIRDEEEGK